MHPTLSTPSFFGRRRIHAAGSTGRSAACRGFTLVEAMVATMVFTVVILGVYSAITKAYQLSQVTRYNDQARAVLISYVDQFQRLETADTIGNQSYVRPFFTKTVATGYGLDNLNRINDTAADENAVVTAADGRPKAITLGDSSNTPITAYMTRTVYPLNVSTGTMLPVETDTTAYYKAPGYALVGIFTISYTLPSGKTYTQRLATTRSIP